MTLLPVVLCGGSGSRLWPLSRAGLPKQVLPLSGELSLLQQTVKRLAQLEPAPAAPVIVCNESHRFMTAAQVEAVGVDAHFIFEPVGRNTAPAVATTALLQIAGGADPESTLLLVLPADHIIRDVDALVEAVGLALPAARDGRLVTFGVVPTAPETGYGYIRVASRGEGVMDVERFVEKPDLETAEQYVQSGTHYWNSGMFLFSVRSLLDELAAHAPGMLEACRRAAEGADPRAASVTLDREAFAACPADSVDFAVMEHTDRASVVPLDAGWSDVGSWSALKDVSPADGKGNVLIGDVVQVDCRDVYLRSESRLVTAVGLDNCIVVETKDALLVVPADRAQDVKKLVDALAAKDREEVRLGREVFRPWGSYDSLENADGFQVKRLTVLPGAILSLQLHHRRAEHWVVVAGIARITRDDEIFELGKNEHTFIPVGTRHRIENPGTELLHIIEVQVGDYLGEDDIVRFEDKYGREGRTD